MGMSESILISLVLCGLAVALTLHLLRSAIPSFGLPFAYLLILHFNHVPGAIAHYLRPELFLTTGFVETGIWQTAVGSLCFVLGVWIARSRQKSAVEVQNEIAEENTRSVAQQEKFWYFCLFGGWILIYGLTPLQSIPSIGAIIEKGGGIWILGTMLGLHDSVLRRKVGLVLRWLSALAVYPILMLLLGGFLSYGASVVIIVLSKFAVTTRSLLRVSVGLVLATVVSLTFFVNYFIVRDQLRLVFWSSASFSERVDVVLVAFSNMKPLDFGDDEQAVALDQRLNQNYLSGLAGYNLSNEIVSYRFGYSFYEAAIAPIPRALWPDKPVFGGSGTIVRDMTGLELSETTSWGVGQVMEFYINFGWSSLVLGFMFLGWLIGHLDISLAHAVRKGNVRLLFKSFLIAVALTQPLGSLVELAGGAIAAYFASLGWSFAWKSWSGSGRPLRAMTKYRR